MMAAPTDRDESHPLLRQFAKCPIAVRMASMCMQLESCWCSNERTKREHPLEVGVDDLRNCALEQEVGR